MLRRGQMIPVEDLHGIARHPPGMAGVQRLDHGFREPRGVTDQRRSDGRFHPIAACCTAPSSTPRCPLCAPDTDAPSALHTALALRQAIWRKAEPTWQVCGIPEVLYTDHGSDFTSKHLEQVCADLKICPVFSQVGQPRGRGRIERFFNTVNQLLLCRLPGYAPAGFATKVTPVLDMQGLHQALEHFVLHEYHQTPHSATGIPPQARWHAGGLLPQLPESLEQLDLLLLTVAQPRKVRRDGIWFLGMRYLDPTLAAYVGESVLVRYDPRDVAEVRVFYHDRFLCRAICQELAGATVPLRDIIRARNRHRRTLRQTIEQRAQIVDTLLSLHRGPPREAEHGASHTAEVGESPRLLPRPHRA